MHICISQCDYVCSYLHLCCLSYFALYFLELLMVRPCVLVLLTCSELRCSYTIHVRSCWSLSIELLLCTLAVLICLILVLVLVPYCFACYVCFACIVFLLMLCRSCPCWSTVGCILYMCYSCAHLCSLVHIHSSVIQVYTCIHVPCLVHFPGCPYSCALLLPCLCTNTSFYFSCFCTGHSFCYTCSLVRLHPFYVVLIVHPRLCSRLVLAIHCHYVGLDLGAFHLMINSLH